MGLAWIPGDVGHGGAEHGGAEPGNVEDSIGHATAAEPARDWGARARHRRPTLLARGSQVVADRFTALASADLGVGRSVGAHVARRVTLPGRRYWT
jgi:hypothetical protein